MPRQCAHLDLISPLIMFQYLIVCALLALLSSHTVGQADVTWRGWRADIKGYEAESRFLAGLKSQVTGTLSHKKFIDHIEQELERMYFKVYSDTLGFTYNDELLSRPKLTVAGQEVDVLASAENSSILLALVAASLLS